MCFRLVIQNNGQPSKPKLITDRQKNERPKLHSYASWTSLACDRTIQMSSIKLQTISDQPALAQLNVLQSPVRKQSLRPDIACLQRLAGTRLRPSCRDPTVRGRYRRACHRSDRVRCRWDAERGQRLASVHLREQLNHLAESQCRLRKAPKRYLVWRS